jgi:hypothetical protein
LIFTQSAFNIYVLFKRSDSAPSSTTSPVQHTVVVEPATDTKCPTDDVSKGTLPFEEEVPAEVLALADKLQVNALNRIRVAFHHGKKV